jgi:septal ring factor EnvC (AmiA/AmiB activator)
MTTTATGRIAPQVLDDDIQAFQALATMTGYDPRDANASIEAVTATFNELQAGKATLIHAQIALDTVRDTLAATEQRFHKQILDVKTQVRAQYGDDSNELAALGLKKKSEKKSPSRRPRGTGTAEG